VPRLLLSLGWYLSAYGYWLKRSDQPSLKLRRGRHVTCDGRSDRLLLADCHCNQLVALTNCINCFLALPNLAEHGVFAVQPIGRDVREKRGRIYTFDIWDGAKAPQLIVIG